MMIIRNLLVRNNREKSEGGQGLVEFALILPILLLIMMGIIDFGRSLFTYAQASNTLRDSLRYGAIAGLDVANPNYANCDEIATITADRGNIWFATDITTTITYDHTGGPTTRVYDNGVYSSGAACPADTDIALGDLLTVHTSTSVEIVTPILSNIAPQLTFDLQGTRTLTGSGVSYGEGIEALTAPNVLSFTCQADHIELTWDDDTTGEVEEWWIFKDSSTIAKITVVDAQNAPNAGGGISGCDDPPGTPLHSCHEDPADFGDTSPHTYSVRAFSSSQGVGPAGTHVTSENVSCPLPAAPSALTTLTLENSACGFGEFYVDLSWTHPDPVGENVTEYRIYRDNEPTGGGTLVQTVTPGSATSCTDCYAAWDGSAVTLYVVPYNGVEAAPANQSVAVPVCTGITDLYLQDNTTADDSSTVPPLADDSNAMNVQCSYTAGAYTIDKSLDYYWLTQAYTVGDTLAAGNYTLYVDVDNISNNKWLEYDIDISVCDNAGSSCTLGGGVSAFRFADTDNGTEVPVVINVPANITINPTERLRVAFVYFDGDNGNFSMDVGTGACSGANNSRIAFP